jgi:ribosome-associated protein
VSDEEEVAADAVPDGALQVMPGVSVPLHEIVLEAVRSQGAGGQNVNKTATAIHLRFDVGASSLPEACKARVLARRDQRLSREGIIVIKAQQHRSQDQNRSAALERLRDLLAEALHVPRSRRPTRIPRSVQKRRVDDKTRRGRTKALRREGPGPHQD